MARWEDDDYWDDEEPPRPERGRPAWDDENFEPPAPPPVPPQPIQKELEGSVYAIPDPLWGFQVPDRDWHPGACVRCAVAERLAFCSKGTDAGRVRRGRFRMVIVEPSERNGLEKTTAFALEGHRIALPILRKIHNTDGWRGALEEDVLRQLQQGLRVPPPQPGEGSP